VKFRLEIQMRELEAFIDIARKKGSQAEGDETDGD
jgi:hypothetical protein